jgi:hypothetical protein
MPIALISGLAFGLFAVFLLFWALENLAYPRSQTTIEAYPMDHRPPRRWLAIFVKGGLGLTMAGLAAYLCIDVFLADMKHDEAVLEVRALFSKKVGREPATIQFERNREPGRWYGWIIGRWELHGTAHFDEWDVWDVTVTWSGHPIRSHAQPRK